MDHGRTFNRRTANVGSGVSYIGDGNFSSGEFAGDASDFDYDYAGFKGDAGRLDWRSAPDLADPAGFSIVHVRQADREPPPRRGPKGYRRSDERILEEIYLHLLMARNVDSSDVSVEVQAGAATLTGTVPERRMKHAIEDLVSSLRDVIEVDNRLRVRPYPSKEE